MRRTAAAALLLASLVILRSAPPAAAGNLPTFLLHALGSRSPAASLTRSPSDGVTVRITAGGYHVKLAGVGSVDVRFDGTTGSWTHFKHGVSRPALFGHETIMVGTSHAEELLTVVKRQGKKTWRWHLAAGALRPTLASGGAVVFRDGSRTTNLRIAPVRVLDAHGRDVTPAGLRWSLRPDGQRAHWLVLRLNDRALPRPYVIDPTTDWRGTRIGTPPLPPTYGPVLYVDNGNPFCSDSGFGRLRLPFCTIGAAASHVTAGRTVRVASGTYNESVHVSASGTARSPILITSAPGANVVVTGGGTNGFLVSGASWVTINGFNVTGTTGQGILVQNSTAVTVSDNHVSLSGRPVSGQSRSGISVSATSSSVVSGNMVDHNTSYGIYLAGCTNMLVKGNTSAFNAFGWQRAASGIRLFGSVANTIAQNFTYDNEDSGIEFDGGANNNLTLENVTWSNGDHGIDAVASPGQRIIGNSVYKNVAAGINVEGNSTGATIANNVSVDNGLASPRMHSDIRVESGSTTGTTMDYDLAYVSQPDTLVIWASVGYTSLAAFQAATGQEQHGLAADPKWANAPGGDFRLTPGSPAIDSAGSGYPDESGTDVLGNPRVDDPASANTGAGPRAYDDRGAYEFQAAPTG